MNEETFNHLCKDVKEIKAALVGTDFGQKGLVERTAELETDVQSLKNFKSKIIYYAAGAAAGGAGSVQFIASLL